MSEHRGISYTDLRDEAVRVLRAAVEAVRAHDYGHAVDIIDERGTPVISELDLTVSKGIIFATGRSRPFGRDQ